MALVSTSLRRQSTLAQVYVEPEANTVAINKMDSNADTCCLGANFMVFSHTGRSANVYPYNNKYDPILNVPIVMGATAYNDKLTNTTYILLFHESLYYNKSLNHSLIN